MLHNTSIGELAINEFPVATIISEGDLDPNNIVFVSSNSRISLAARNRSSLVNGRYRTVIVPSKLPTD